MLTLDRKQRPLALSEQKGFTPPFLAGLLFAALGVVPLSSSGPLTATRVLGLLLLGSASALLMALGSPRTRERSLARLSAHPSRVAERGVALELDGYALPPTYRAVMVFGDGTRRTLLERSEPAGVLEDAVLLSRELGAPLVAGWGIDDGAIAALLPAGSHAHRFESDRAITFDSPPFAGQRNAAWTTLWASAFVVVATILMSESARAKVTPSALSLVLPGLGAFIVLLLGIRRARHAAARADARHAPSLLVQARARPARFRRARSGRGCHRSAAWRLGRSSRRLEWKEPVRVPRARRNTPIRTLARGFFAADIEPRCRMTVGVGSLLIASPYDEARNDVRSRDFGRVRGRARRAR